MVVFGLPLLFFFIPHTNNYNKTGGNSKPLIILFNLKIKAVILKSAVLLEGTPAPVVKIVATIRLIVDIINNNVINNIGEISNATFLRNQ